LPVDLSAELTKQIEAAGLANYATGLLSQIAEMQKQIEALNLLPLPTQGSLTNGTSLLYGDGSGGFSNATTGSGVSFVAGVLSATGSGGTITSVTATAPIASSGGFTPNISINAAYGDTVNPYAAKTANYVLAGPTSGAAAVPVFRALVAADIPSLSYVTSVSGTSPVVSSGGTTPAISMPAATASVNGYLTSTDWNTFNNKGSGTVTSVAALTLGTTGTDLSSSVATGTTTPVITLNVPTASASNRGALSAADWTTFNNKGSGTVTSVTGTSPVVSSGGTTPAISMAAASASVSGYLTSTDWNTFNGKGSGTVTSVTGTAPVVSSGGATPAISMAAATTSVSGYLTSTDWTTFNGKQAALVSGTNIKTVNGTSLLGSGDVGTITYAYGGTGQTTVTTGDLLYGSAANTWSKLGIGSTGQVLRVVSGAPAWGTDYVGTVTSVAATVPSFLSISGSPITSSGTLAISYSGTALPTTSGGTGLTSFTANGVVYASSTSALATGSALTFDGTNFATTGTATATKLIPTGTSVTGNGMYLPNTNSIGISTAGVNAFYIDASQNVGIGTSSPSSYGKFSVYNANVNGTATFLHPGNTSYGTVVTLETYAGTDSPALSFKNYNSGSPVYYSISENSSGALLFNSSGSVSSAGTERMRLDSSGNLLAAKTTPGQVLTAGFEYNNTNNNQYLSICNNGGGNAPFYIANKASGSTALANFYSGSTLVGNITSNGTITVYGTTSDYRLKKVIGPVADAGQRIDALQPVEYTWNSDGSRTRGFLAHQFQEVYASSVTGAKDAVDADGKPVYQAMQASSSEVIADLVAEIQSLRKRLTALEGKS
jgi:hypothetical protein